MTIFSVRPANDEDSKDVWEWRNDPLTRNMSLNSRFVEWDDHRKWFSASINLRNRILLICENDFGEKISIVRFDISQSEALTSINLNPNQRGKGLAKNCLIQSINYFSERNLKIKKLNAEIKEENIPSQKAFLEAGFKKYDLDGNIGHYIKKLT